MKSPLFGGLDLDTLADPLVLKVPCDVRGDEGVVDYRRQGEDETRETGRAKGKEQGRTIVIPASLVLAGDER